MEAEAAEIESKVQNTAEKASASVDITPRSQMADASEDELNEAKAMQDSLRRIKADMEFKGSLLKNSFSASNMQVLSSEVSQDAGGDKPPAFDDDAILDKDSKPDGDGSNVTLDTLLLESISERYNDALKEASDIAAASVTFQEKENSLSPREAYAQSIRGPPPGYNNAPIYEDPVAENPSYQSTSSVLGASEKDEDASSLYGVVLQADGTRADDAPRRESNTSLYAEVTNSTVDQSALEIARQMNHEKILSANKGGPHTGSESRPIKVSVATTSFEGFDSGDDMYAAVLNSQVDTAALAEARNLQNIRSKEVHAQSPEQTKKDVARQIRVCPNT